MKRYYSEALTFDDVLLVPRYGRVESRREVDLTMNLNDVELSLPVIAAPMDTVCEARMAIAIGLNGGLGIIHRYLDIEDQVSHVDAAKNWSYDSGIPIKVGAAVGATGDYYERAARLIEVGTDVILVDIANGHSEYVLNAVERLVNEFETTHIMAGNISTGDGYNALAEVGCNSVRVGIGGGSACTTRIVSGHGLPTLASVMEISERKHARRVRGLAEPAIIADGGIRSSGDMVKAFAAGADAVMLGSMLAGTDEAPGKVIYREDGRAIAKAYRGMASDEAQQDWRGKSNGAEGISTTVPAQGPVVNVLDQIRLGLGSGCSYSGVDKLADLATFAQYVTVTSNGVAESRPHAKEIR